MTKKRMTEILKIVREHELRPIKETMWHNENAFIFHAAGDFFIWQIHIHDSDDGHWATRQSLSAVSIHEAHDITHWFFDEEE